MTNQTVQQLKQHLNEWVVLSEPNEKIVGSGKDVLEAKTDAEHNGYQGKMTFFKVFHLTSICHIKMQFPYQKVPATNNPRDPWFPLPLIKVRLSWNEKTIQVNALIDSGAASGNLLLSRHSLKCHFY